MRKWLAPVFFIVTAGFVTISAASDEMAAKGKMLATLVDNRDIGYQDSIAKVVMTITNSAGKSTVRKLDFKLLEAQVDGDKSLIKFDFPADIRGTALLTHPKLNSSDSQWLYLPSINRTKRVSSRNKSGAFLGSEFSFEDLTDKSVDDYTYQYLGEDICEFSVFDAATSSNKPIKGLCDKLARMPKDKHSGYSKQELVIDREAKRIVQIDYYDVKGALLKQMFSHNFKLHDDKYWRAGLVDMQNKQSGKSTSLEYESISFGNQLSNSAFKRSALYK